MNSSGRYSNVLTMLLIVFIVAILGVIVYFAYDIFNTKQINDNAKAKLEEFEEKTKKKVQRETSSSSTSKESQEENNANRINDLYNELAEINSQKANKDPEPAERGEPEKTYMGDYEIVGSIEIPKTKLECPILEKVTTGSLKLSICLANGGELNKSNICVLFGHNYRRKGVFFSDNKNLSKGDVIYITDRYGTKVTYEIYNVYQTTDYDTAHFSPSSGEEGVREISLQTCTDDGANRIIVLAKEKK